MGVMEFDDPDAGLGPTLLVAVTVNVYSVPLVRPVSTMEGCVVVAVMLPGSEVTVYKVIGEPPLDAGAFQVMLACPFPAVATIPVGELGMVTGVMEFDDPDAGLVPTLSVAVTLNVYSVPLVRPVSTMDDCVVVAVMLPGDEMTL